MTTPDHPSPAPDAPEPEFPDRIYRSSAGIASGVMLLVLVGWLGIDALIRGHGRTPWLALATLILVVPLVVAFTLRPAVFANEDRLRVRNPFRIVVLPWSSVAALRSGYSNEVVAESGTKYQLWAVPVSLRGRKKAARAQVREAEGRGTGRSLTGLPTGPTRAQPDLVMDALRELAEKSEATSRARTAQGEPSVRWAYEVLAPALAGAVLLAILLAAG